MRDGERVENDADGPREQSRSRATTPDAAGPQPLPPSGRVTSQRRPASRILIRLALSFYGAMFGLAWAGACWSGRSLLYASAEAADRGIDWLADSLLGAATAAGVIVLSLLFTARTGLGRRLGRALGEALGPLRVRDCLVLAAASGLGEEALFRGALQPHLGWVATSLLFGLAHFVPRRELMPWTAFSVAAGFLLGGLFEWTGNLVAPVVAHAGINAVNLRLLARRYGTPPPATG